MEKEVVILELRDLLHDKRLKRKILPFFESFSSGKLDSDIQIFLKDYALKYEQAGISRTVLIFNESETELLGYFSLGLNTLHFSKEVRELTNFQKVKNAYQGIDLFKYNSRPVYKLFMIGKNFNVKSNTSGFMDYCFNDLIWERICTCNSYVGSDLMYLDCENNERLVKTYEKQGFEIFETYEYKDQQTNELVKMVRMITNI